MQAILDGLLDLLNAIQYLGLSVFNFLKWLPDYLEVSNQIWSCIPYPFLGCVVIIGAIYILKVILGGDNGV